MATSSGPVILPQFQGDYLDVQRKQQLAQALMGVAMNNGGDQLNRIGAGMPVMPKYNIGSGLAQLGQALLAAKLGNDSVEGMRNLGAQQMQFLMGSPQSAQPATQNSDAAPVGVSSGGGLAGSMQVANPFGDGSSDTSALANALSAQRSGGFLSPGGPNNPAGLPSQMAAQLYLSDPTEYWKTQVKQYDPTEATKMARAAGVDPTQANLGALTKANYIAPVSGGPGGYLAYADGRTEQLPHVPDGFTSIRDQNGRWVITPVQGGLAAMADAAAATAGGKSRFELKEVWDPNANNGRGGYVQQTVSNVADAANGSNTSGTPGFTPFQNAVQQVESKGNPNAYNPASGASGSMQTMPGTLRDPGFGVPPAANNSPAEKRRVGADYATAMQKRYGNDADAAVAYNWGPDKADKWIAAGRPWSMLPDQTKAYVGQVLTQQQNFSQSPRGVFGYPGQQGTPPGTPSVPQGYPGAPGTPSPRNGPMASQPPLGATNAANSAQGAPSKQMADLQGSLADSDNVYQQSREALTGMINLAKNQGFGGTVARFAPEGVATRLSNDAAEYGKLHANYVSLQGKALGSAGSDASRATINESVPTYDKPQDAKIAGLTNQLNQLDLMHLKRQVLNPIFQQGDEKAYMQQSAAFDNTIKPSMMPQIQNLLAMSGGPDRAKALQAAQQNPEMKKALDLISGMFK